MTLYDNIASNKRNTIFLIGLFLIIIILLGWLFSYLLDTPAILPIAIIIAIFQTSISYWFSDSITMAISGARQISRDQSPKLHRIVENLSITAGLPLPRIFIINDSAPNAFATGRDPNHAAIAVTTGLLEKLEKSELEGVIAHEMAHIGNYDIRLMTIVVVLVGIVVLVSDLFLRWSFWGGGRRRSSDDANQLTAVFALLAITLAILAPIAASLIQLTISRKREFIADSAGAMLTRYPEGLARALEKIATDPEPLEVANKATAHLYIENPLKGHRSWLNNLFSTHPPVEERVKALLIK